MPCEALFGTVGSLLKAHVPSYTILLVTKHPFKHLHPPACCYTGLCLQVFIFEGIDVPSADLTH